MLLSIGNRRAQLRNAIQAAAMNSTSLSIDPKLAKKIEYLYRSMKPMVVLGIVGVLIPLILLLVAALGLVYAAQRSSLLKKVGSDFSSIPEVEIQEQLEYIRDHSFRLFFPAIMVGVYVAFIAIFVAVAILGS